jgi:hypothetical protein
MTLEVRLQTHGYVLNPAEERQIYQQLEGLERRLVHRPAPVVEVVLTPYAGQRRVETALRVLLGPLGPHLVSHQSAETAGHAVRLAVSDVERQLERRLAKQRGTPSFGVPSRRLPAEARRSPDQEAAAESPTPRQA